MRTSLQKYKYKNSFTSDIAAAITDLLQNVLKRSCIDPENPYITLVYACLKQIFYQVY